MASPQKSLKFSVKGARSEPVVSILVSSAFFQLHLSSLEKNLSSTGLLVFDFRQKFAQNFAKFSEKVRFEGGAIFLRCSAVVEFFAISAVW